MVNKYRKKPVIIEAVQYNGINLFELMLHNQLQQDITNTKEYTYEWRTKGTIYRNEQWIESKNLIISTSSTQNLLAWQHNIRPINQFNGECLSNVIECIVKKNGTTLVTLKMPIHMYLNRYGLAALNDWDGNSIEINKNGGYILSPQMGAGFKDEENNFTGIVMGQVKASDKTNIETGLLGYAKGIRSIFLDAETGRAEFGTTAKIIINPEASTDNEATAQIYSDTYSTTSKSGMLIDFGSNPRIHFGSGNFKVDSSGYMTAKGGGEVAGWQISNETLKGEDVGLRSTAPVVNGEKNKKADAIWAGTKFSVDFNGNLYADDADISGTISADAGYIGNFTIEDDYLYSGEHSSFDSSKTGIYLGEDGISIGDGFSVDDNGVLTASNVTVDGLNATNVSIEGDITGTSSTFYLAEDDSSGMLFVGSYGTQTKLPLAYFSYNASDYSLPTFQLYSESSIGLSIGGFSGILIGDSGKGNVGIYAQSISLNSETLSWNGEDLVTARFG